MARGGLACDGVGDLRELIVRMTDMTGPALRRAGRTPRHRGHALFLTLAVGLAAWGVTRAVVPPDHTSETSSQPAAATAGNAAASPAASRPADRDTTLGSKLAVAQRPGDAPPVQNAAKGPVGGTDKAAAPGGSPRDTAPSTNAQAATPTTTPTDATPPAVRGPKNPVTDYGLWVLAPAIVAILLAALTRQVVPALVAGILLGAFMMLGCLPASNVHTQHNSLIGGVRLAVEAYILGTIRDPDHNFAHLKIIVFTLLIGFMVGVIGKNGGTRGMVRLVTGESRSPRRGALTAWLAGMVVFFDDYANTMIVGPTMRSVFDRLKLSRAKLAYIVDSTAAPVSSIALIGTWVGTEISYIEQGLTQAAADGLPLVDANGVPLTGMGTFLASIPYRFYPLLALFLVFIVALTGRDIGPMKRAERKALSRIDRDAVSARGTEVEAGEAKPCWWLGIFPILALVLGTVIVLIATGMHGAPATDPASSAAGLNTAVAAAVEQVPSWWQRASNVVAHADSYISIFYGAILASVVAVGLTLVARTGSLRGVV
ncbi:MAG: Na+/H+ antiporter NhaC family protein, partial [Phycisphaerae bacterium]